VSCKKNFPSIVLNGGWCKFRRNCARITLWTNLCLELWKCLAWDADTDDVLANLTLLREYLWNFKGTRTLLFWSCIGSENCVTSYLISISKHFRAHSALQRVKYSRNSYFLAFALRFVWRKEPRLDDGLLFAKSLLSHSLVHLAVVSVLRAIRFPSSL